MRSHGFLAMAIAGACVLGSVTACSDPPVNTVNYVIDGAVTTYNPGSLGGSTEGSLMALSRVLPGFSYLGPDGGVLADTDIGTAVVTDSDTGRLVVRYQVNPLAVYSDGVPLTCDALMLAWAAHSGAVGGFDVDTTAGYRDIESVDCQAGARTASVTFKSGRAYKDWKALFGAGTLLPPQVITAKMGISSVVDVITGSDPSAKAELARVWNGAWKLLPGEVGPDPYPALGPLRVQEYTHDDGLVLTANTRWWGDPPATDRITVWPRQTEMTEEIAGGDAGSVDVLDIATGAYGVDPAPRVQANAESLPPVAQVVTMSSLGVERLVFSRGGVFADAAVRRAFAACIPRDSLAREFGRGAQVANYHILGPDDLLSDSVNAQFGGEYVRADPERAGRELAAARAGRPELVVRIGYVGPDSRRAQMVSAIAASCGRAGVTVTDNAGPQIGPASLGRDVDILITASGNGFAATGAADPTRDSYAFVRGEPINVGGYDNERVSALIEQLAVTVPPAQRLPLLREIESLLWRDMPVLPLFVEARTRLVGDNMNNVVVGMSRTGAGWNIDRWLLTNS
ncbi:ABC transporter substrate-binding protein [Nocardia sp. 348MFTsu5.1]|uniref:ABC transporter substrate-binding protein n=1 Tax=Nocardia sp. 348MFTsu5.1 TaxID=1172185 RepID=UPI0003A3D58C|nr:ABC transporter substrate-binding protein [Nocardia sp. 348MFTsu5.1]